MRDARTLNWRASWSIHGCVRPVARRLTFKAILAIQKRSQSLGPTSNVVQFNVDRIDQTPKPRRQASGFLAGSLPSLNLPGRSVLKWTKGAMTRLAPGPDIRLALATRSSRPTCSQTQGLVFASIETRASQSLGSAISSKRSIGGKTDLMIRYAFRPAYPRSRGVLAHQPPRSASRYERILAKEKMLPSAMISTGVRPPKKSFGLLTQA